MKLLMLKGLGCLKPADRISDEAIKKFERGELIRISIDKTRSLQHHRWFWALITAVHDNLPDHMLLKWSTPERLMDDIKVMIGLCEEREAFGEKYIKLGSISFDNMDQLEFDRCSAQAIEVIRNVILPGIEEHELREAVELELSNFGA